MPESTRFPDGEESARKARRVYLELGVRVRQRRDELKLTQEQLAKRIGISRSSLANIERGRHYAPVHLLLALAEALQVEMGELLPTHEQLNALVDMSRGVPKFVSIGGERSLMPSQVVQLVGQLLTASTDPSLTSLHRRPSARSTKRAKGS